MTLSLCIIVGNNTEEIKKCLASVEGYLFDEVVVTFTQPGEEVRAAVSEFNSILNLVTSEFTWIDDFSAARNHCFDQATSDYIMWMDSDDTLTQENYSSILMYKSTLGEYDCHFLKYHYAMDENGSPTVTQYRERIVKNDPKYRWTGLIHETILVPAGTPHTFVDFAVSHTNRTYNGSLARNIRILKKVVDSGKASCREKYYLGRDMYHEGEAAAGTLIMERYILENNDFFENVAEASCHVARFHIEKQKYDEALKWLNIGYYKFPNNPECNYLRGCMYKYLGNNEEAKKAFLESISSEGKSLLHPNTLFGTQYSQVELNSLKVIEENAAFGKTYKFTLGEFDSEDGHTITVSRHKKVFINSTSVKDVELAEWLSSIGYEYAVSVEDRKSANNDDMLKIISNAAYVICPNTYAAQELVLNGVSNPVLLYGPTKSHKYAKTDDVFVVGDAYELDVFIEKFPNNKFTCITPEDYMYGNVICVGSCGYVAAVSAINSRYHAVTPEYVSLPGIPTAADLDCPVFAKNYSGLIALDGEAYIRSCNHTWDRPVILPKQKRHHVVILGSSAKSSYSVFKEDPSRFIKVYEHLPSNPHTETINVANGRYCDYLPKGDMVTFLKPDTVFEPDILSKGRGVFGYGALTLPVEEAVLNLGANNPIAEYVFRNSMSPDVTNFVNEKKTYVVYTGKSWEKWDLNRVESGFGGSETWAAMVCRELAIAGHDVTLFADIPGERHIDRYGVTWVHHSEAESILADKSVDVFISSRVSYALSFAKNAKKRVALAHDIFFLEANYLHYADEIYSLSEWHSQFLANYHGIDISRIKVAANGVDADLYKERLVKSNSMVYSSSLDRGLERLVKSLPLIREVYPDFTVYVAYGMQTWEQSIIDAGGDPATDYKFQKAVALLQTPGIVYLGRISKKELAEYQLRSKVWAYPVNFDETFCITAVENVMAKNKVITYARAGLTTTLSELENVFVGDGATHKPQYFADKVIDAIFSYSEEEAERSKRIISKYSWKNAADYF